MTQTDSHRLYNEVLALIRKTPGLTMRDISNELIAAERPVDRALQRLRHEGKIAYDRKKGWTACP